MVTQSRVQPADSKERIDDSGAPAASAAPSPAGYWQGPPEPARALAVWVAYAGPWQALTGPRASTCCPVCSASPPLLAAGLPRPVNSQLHEKHEGYVKRDTYPAHTLNDALCKVLRGCVMRRMHGRVEAEPILLRYQPLGNTFQSSGTLYTLRQSII